MEQGPLFALGRLAVDKRRKASCEVVEEKATQLSCTINFGDQCAFFSLQEECMHDNEDYLGRAAQHTVVQCLCYDVANREMPSKGGDTLRR